MTKYNTNLAAEFYVLACLHRLGVTANLTLGNKKGVDIVVVREAGDAVLQGAAARSAFAAEWPGSVQLPPAAGANIQTQARRRWNSADCRSTVRRPPIACSLRGHARSHRIE